MMIGTCFKPWRFQLAAALALGLSVLAGSAGRADEPTGQITITPGHAQPLEPIQYIDPAATCYPDCFPEEPCCGDAWSCCPIPPWNYYLGGYGGVSYFDVPGESLLGGTYGVNGAIRLFGPLGVWGNLGVNHISGGEQVLGSVGLLRTPSCDRWSFLLVFDQFTDTRIDGLYLSQAWLQFGYELTNSFQAGVVYTEPVSGDDDVLFFDPLVGFNSGSLAITRSVGIYAVYAAFNNLLTGQVGYREDPDTLYLAGGVSVPLAERASAYANASYEDSGTWAGSAGIAFVLGPKRRCSGCGCTCETVRGGKKKLVKKLDLAVSFADSNKSINLRKGFGPQNFYQATRATGTGIIFGTNRRGNVQTTTSGDACLKIIQDLRSSGVSKSEAIVLCKTGQLMSSCPNPSECLAAIEQVYGQ